MIIIIGGGVMGCSTAYHLAKAGIPATVLEMDAIGAKASGKAAGFLDSLVVSVFYSCFTQGNAEDSVRQQFAQVADAGFKMFPAIVDDIRERTEIDVQYQTGIQLRCAMSQKEEETLLSVSKQVRQLTGIEVEIISGDESRRIEPLLSPRVRLAVKLPYARVEPYRYTLGLAEVAEQMGIEIVLHQATAFRFSSETGLVHEVQAGSRWLPCEALVVAAGPWSDAILWQLGISYQSRMVRGQMLRLTCPTVPQNYVVYNPEVDGMVCDMLVFPCADGSLLAGYTGDTDGVTADSDNPTARSRQVISECLADFVPVLANASIVEHRAAVLANPPQGGLVLGRAPGWQNVYLALVGDGGIGVSPLTGQSIARLIQDDIVGRRDVGA